MTNVSVHASALYDSFGVYNVGATPGMTVDDVAAGSHVVYEVYNVGSNPAITHVTATATGTGFASAYGVYNNSVSSPVMTFVTATATGPAATTACAIIRLQRSRCLA